MNLMRIFHLLMAFQIFIASNGALLNNHYCGLDLQSVSLFKKAKTCHDHASESFQQQTGKACCAKKKVVTAQHACCAKKPSQSTHKQYGLNKSACCNESHFYVLGNSVLEKTSSPEFPAPVFHAVSFEPCFEFYLTGSIEDSKLMRSLSMYDPPPIILDVPVLFANYRC